MTSKPSSGHIYIGTSGFSYDPWADGVFYPKGLPRKEWLPFYASQFGSVELNLTFQKLPEKESFVQWQTQVPPEFRFSMKGYQYITHLKKLTGVSEPLRLLMDRVTKLKENLSCILWEIPPLPSTRMKLLEGFFQHLKKYPHIRHAFEIKDPAFPLPETIALLAENGMTLAHESSWDENEAPLQSLPFRYLRESGKGNLKILASKVGEISREGKDCYVYFYSDEGDQALRSARELTHLLQNPS
ncbi:MAG: DUF72 domain-containing protein [bacterium]